MTINCPRCDADSNQCRVEHRGKENDVICWTVYHCNQCSYTWRDSEGELVTNRLLRESWTLMTSLDPEDYPHNIPPPYK